MASVLFATSNPHKLVEARAVLEPLKIEVIGLSDIPNGASIPDPEETGKTFEENARIKAVAYARATGRWCLADDSGLEVDALEGRPGVYSARYSGRGETRAERDQANNERLLDELAEVPEWARTARFVCALCLSDPGGEVRAETRGLFEGYIRDQAAGENGFGYDPLFYLPEVRMTNAELPPHEKNARSHRGKALRQLAPVISELMST